MRTCFDPRLPVCLILTLFMAGCSPSDEGFQIVDVSGKACPNQYAPERVLLTGGTFQMGSDTAYPEERPRRVVTVGNFAITAYEITNAQFAAFVEDTNYETLAERTPDPALHPEIPEDQLVPGSAVFIPPQGAEFWWQFVPGAHWQAPEGPGSNISDRMDHPVVHLAYDDVRAYASWVGGRLEPVSFSFQT